MHLCKASSLAIRLLETKSPEWIQTASIMKLKMPSNFDHVVLPERRRLPLLPKIPQPLSQSKAVLKNRKHIELMRGPEEVHNEIIYGDYGIQATQGGRLQYGHLEGIRMIILRRINQEASFAVWRVDAPWQSVSKRVLGVKLGGGKGKTSKFVIPIKPDRMILEIGGSVVIEEVQPYLDTIVNMLPFDAKIVSRKSMEEEKKENIRLEKENQNMFTFEYVARRNMLGIKRHLSPYDYKWFGKYR